MKETLLSDAELSFTRSHDQFLEQWKHAMYTGETDGVDRMANTYFVAFFMNNQPRPDFFEYDEAMEGMRQSVKECVGFEKSFENRIIRMKNQTNAIVFYEQILKNGERELSRLFTTEEWELQGDQWLLTREVDIQV